MAGVTGRIEARKLEPANNSLVLFIPSLSSSNKAKSVLFTLASRVAAPFVKSTVRLAFDKIIVLVTSVYSNVTIIL